jgi:4'-phosphopantetheinyl transferase
VPIPINGYFWSLSHKAKLVGGVINDQPVGFDIEEIRERREGLFSRVAAEKEWKLFRERNPKIFTQVWSAKEAVVKANGKGIAAIRSCRLAARPEENILLLVFNGKNWLVNQVMFDDHVISVASDGKAIQWNLPG